MFTFVVLQNFSDEIFYYRQGRKNGFNYNVRNLSNSFTRRTNIDHN